MKPYTIVMMKGILNTIGLRGFDIYKKQKKQKEIKRKS